MLFTIDTTIASGLLQTFVFRFGHDCDVISWTIDDIAGCAEEQVAVGTDIQRVIACLVAVGGRDGESFSIGIAAGGLLFRYDTDCVDRFVLGDEADTGLKLTAKIAVDPFASFMCLAGRIRRVVGIGLPFFTIGITVASGRIAKDVHQANRTSRDETATARTRTENVGYQLLCSSAANCEV